jgi:membrane protease YdiL (CAAX protease family)
MSSFRGFVRKHAVLTYFTLTFLFTWGCMALAVYPGGFPITEEQFETAGALVYVAMLVGPSFAGIVLTGFIDGRAGMRELWSRLIRWKVGLRWYASALLTAPFLVTLTLLILSRFSPEFLPAIFTSDDKLALLISAVAVGLIVGLFEELGWTGFAVPRLRLRYGIAATGLIVGFIWGAWHFPPFWESDTFLSAFPLALLLGRLFSWLPPYRMLMVRVYDRTESLLVLILMHASLVASLNALVAVELSRPAMLTWILAWAVVLWIVVSVVAIINQKQSSSQQVRSQAA